MKCNRMNGHAGPCGAPDCWLANAPTETSGARLFAIDDALDSDAWYTPPWIFEGLGVTFDLDVAAPAEKLDWLPARQRYTVAEDGLNLPWHGLVWCNPPYSAPTKWCRRWDKQEAVRVLGTHGGSARQLRTEAA